MIAGAVSCSCRTASPDIWLKASEKDALAGSAGVIQIGGFGDAKDIEKVINSIAIQQVTRVIGAQDDALLSETVGIFVDDLAVQKPGVMLTQKLSGRGCCGIGLDPLFEQALDVKIGASEIDHDPGLVLQ